MPDPQSLIPLGLNAYEAAAYIALLGRPELAPADVAKHAGIPRQRVYDVLTSLSAKGLCIIRSTSPKTYAAVNPKNAIDLLVKEREANLERQQKETKTLASQMIEELAPIFAIGRGKNDPLAYVEVLSGQNHIAYRAQSLAQTAKLNVKSCIKPPMILTAEQNQTFMQDPLERGLEYRALCESRMLEDIQTRQWIGQFIQSGLELRVSESLPLKMQAFDDEIVLISMQDPVGGQPNYTAVAIHNRGAVAMLNLAFEHIWASADVFKG